MKSMVCKKIQTLIDGVLNSEKPNFSSLKTKIDAIKYEPSETDNALIFEDEPLTALIKTYLIDGKDWDVLERAIKLSAGIPVRESHGDSATQEGESLLSETAKEMPRVLNHEDGIEIVKGGTPQHGIVLEDRGLKVGVYNKPTFGEVMFTSFYNGKTYLLCEYLLPAKSVSLIRPSELAQMKVVNCDFVSEEPQFIKDMPRLYI